MEVKEVAGTKKVQEGFQQTEGTTGLVHSVPDFFTASADPCSLLLLWKVMGKRRKAPEAESQRQH